MSTENEKTYNGSGSARVLCYEVEAESYIASAKILPYFPPYFPPVNFCAFRCTSYALGTTSIYRCIVLPWEINFPLESSRDLEGSCCNGGAYHFAIYLVQNTWPILNCLHFHYIASSHSWTK